MSESRYTPAYDNKIYQKFSKKTIQNKIKNKIALCQDLGIPYDKKVPLFCITYPLTDKNNLAILQEIMAGILEQPIQLAMTGIGTEKYQKYFTELGTKYPHKIIILPDNDENKRKIYAAGDGILVLSDTMECLRECKQAIQYGAVPITPPNDLVQDYNPNMESGNAFIYSKGNSWSLFATLIRALENYRFPFDWKNIQVEGME
ncbi:hypothetical protein HZA43_02820 [Candidatus Peregrinibacteria bacterium]|nr:hypothetical protein [Candidatus Peregrinibacteria bacterium]